jgi:hypothetical protein
MKRLINAVIELLEAKAELLREEACTLELGTYARGYKDGQEDGGIYCGSDCDCDTEAGTD